MHKSCTTRSTHSFRAVFVTRIAFSASLIVSLAGLSIGTAAAEQQRVYIGTYTSGESKGIYLLDLDMKTGKLASRGLVAETVNPSFLALHPNGRYMYAVNEVDEFDGQESGSVSAFRIDRKSGTLSLLNQRSSHGGAPCHLTIDRAGKHLLLANYSGGSVAVLPLHNNGRLGEATSIIQHHGESVDRQRQTKPHAHSINLDAKNRFALAADLGLDQVLIYQYDAGQGKLKANHPAFAKLKGGAGPRHLAFHPGGTFVYVINEMQLTVTVFAYERSKGELKELQTVSTLPGDIKPGYSTAEVQVHPSGKFLYGSNRGHDTIAVFAIDPRTGKLTPVEHEPTGGRTPRNFGIEPSGQYLLAANQSSDNVVVFRIDPDSGKLTPAGQQAGVPSPVCVKFSK